VLQDALRPAVTTVVRGARIGVRFNPASKICFSSGSQFYGKTKAGGFTCRAFADKAGFRASKGN
jgi:hypothetical protein